MRTLKEAARLIGIQHRSLYSRIERGRLPEAVKKGGRWVIPDEIIAPYINSLTVTETVRHLRSLGRTSCKQTIYNCVADGRLKATRDHQGILRIKLSDLKETFNLPDTGRKPRA